MHQLERVESSWRSRREIWEYYNRKLAGLPVRLPLKPSADTRHAYHLYTILIDEEKTGITRDAFLDAMTAHNIGVGVHYLSIPEHPYYRERFGWKPEDFPQAQRIGRMTVSLPLSARLTEADREDVIRAVRAILESSPTGAFGPRK
jgi:dTDP-4-amino-4,6-dideoxygalactose transaminase